MIEVRATINLPGLRRGQLAEVDPDVPYVAKCLVAGYVVPVHVQHSRETPTVEEPAMPKNDPPDPDVLEPGTPEAPDADDDEDAGIVPADD